MSSDFPLRRTVAIGLLSSALISAGWLSYPYDAWLGGLFALLWFGFAASLVRRAVRSAWRSRSDGVPALAVPASCIVVLLACWFATVRGFRTVDWFQELASFEAEKDKYDRIVRKVSTMQLAPGRHSIDVGQNFIVPVEVSDVVRVSVKSDGFSGNWIDTYYDPSDSFAGLKQRKRAHRFGGTVYGCERLEGHYYRCAFDLEEF